MIEYLVELVGFAVVVLVIAKWILPVVNRGITERQDTIRQQLEEAEEAKRRLAAAREEYAQALAEARKEAERLEASAREQGEAILAEMRERADAEARRVVEQAHQQIAADQQQTLNELHATAGRLTAGLAERITRESLKDETLQSRVIDRFLDELEDRARRPPAAATRRRRAAPSAKGSDS